MHWALFALRYADLSARLEDRQGSQANITMARMPERFGEGPSCSAIRPQILLQHLPVADEVDGYPLDPSRQRFEPCNAPGKNPVNDN